MSFIIDFGNLRKNRMNKPILILIYKRPSLTKRLLSSLSNVKPKKIYVAGDGPKDDVEENKVQETRDAIKSIDWDTNVKTNYSTKNLGLRKRVSSALDWFFENEKAGIILEDDLIPNKSFFEFSESLLEKYKHEDQVTTISGNNFLFDRLDLKYDYYFTRYPHCWGWATWARAWKKYDHEMDSWPEVKKTRKLKDIFGGDPFLESYWTSIFQKVYEGKIDSWSYIWTYSNLIKGGLSINPSQNLVSNIGFGREATHTKVKSRVAEMDTHKLKFPLKHPSKIKRNKKADTITERTIFVTPRMMMVMILGTIKARIRALKEVFFKNG